MKIIFEDSDIIVVEKAAGEVVHPAPGYESGTMSDVLKKKYPEIASVGSKERPGVVHRLDRDTSGVMVFARTQRAYLKLRRAFESHTEVEKTYLAVCHGAPRPLRGTINSPVGRERLCAVSHYSCLGKRNGVSIIEFKIDTGRTHQIRIHASELGCPILGDTLYGDKNKDRKLRKQPPRLLLHAVKLSFKHPISGKNVEFISDPPAELVYSV